MTKTIRGEVLQAGYTTDNQAKKRHDDALEVELITKGGKCQMTQNVGLAKFDSGKIDVPVFDVVEKGPVAVPGVGLDLGKDILFMVQQALESGAKHVVWVSYYDMSYAQIDPKRLLLDYGVAERWIPDLRKVAFFETPGAQPEVRKRLDWLQAWICAGVAAGKEQADLTAQQAGKPKPGPADCIGWKDSGFNAATDIQDTAPGGSPHPSEAGQKKLAAAVQKKL